MARLVIWDAWRPLWRHCNVIGNFKYVISEHGLGFKFMSMSCEIELRWMPQNIFDDKSTLFQLVVWCRQATSHCVSQCWFRSTSPFCKWHFQINHNRKLMYCPTDYNSGEVWDVCWRHQASMDKNGSPCALLALKSLMDQMRRRI